MYRECELCGQTTDRIERHHLIGGTANRRLSEKYGLVMYLCRECHYKAHHDNDTRLLLHRYGEKMFLRDQNATVDDFIAVFGKNYLTEE